MIIHGLEWPHAPFYVRRADRIAQNKLILEKLFSNAPALPTEPPSAKKPKRGAAAEKVQPTATALSAEYAG